ncbi:MAG TPA: NAD(P)-dependent oxidoreductase [Methylomirabilota bacterium]|nr:NAD(P)-dependent oxidoreductase [Methylomirabilota bacterium]
MSNRVGFIGLGTMGLPMVTNLTKAGHAVVACDVSPAALEAARGLPGVEAVASPKAVAERSAALFTCLPNDDVVRRVYLGPDGIAAGGRSGLVTGDCSTVSPEATLEVHRALAAHGIAHLDTPMLGSQPQAVAGEIFFIVGGDPAPLGRIEPYLTAMGKLHLHVGPIGTGNRIKLMHNGLAAVIAVAVAEALGTCVKAGVDPSVLYEVVCKGGGMAYGTYWERRAKRVVDGEFAPTFMLQHMVKDARLALEHARSAEVPTPLLAETLQTYEEALADGWGAQDFSAVSHVIEKRIGRPLSGN